MRLIHLHAVLKNTQLPCYCNLREGLEEYFILVEMGFPEMFCKRTKFKLNQTEQRKTQNITPCIISSTSKKQPVKVSDEQIRWAMSEAITDDGKT